MLDSMSIMKFPGSTTIGIDEDNDGDDDDNEDGAFLWSYLYHVLSDGYIFCLRRFPKTEI